MISTCFWPTQTLPTWFPMRVMPCASARPTPQPSFNASTPIAASRAQLCRPGCQSAAFDRGEACHRTIFGNVCCVIGHSGIGTGGDCCWRWPRTEETMGGVAGGLDGGGSHDGCAGPRTLGGTVGMSLPGTAGFVLSDVVADNDPPWHSSLGWQRQRTWLAGCWLMCWSFFV